MNARSILMMMLIMLMMAATCRAEIVDGMAPIINSDISKARQDAINDAKRSYLERVVGTRVTSTTEVVNAMVVVDRIMTRAEGFIMLNRIISEGVQGDVYAVRIDLTASPTLIDTEIADVKTRLEILDDDSIRSGVVFAVSGIDENGRRKNSSDLTNYVGQTLQAQGFVTYGNDEVAVYVSGHDMSNAMIVAEARRLARNYYEGANSILSGTLSTVKLNRSGKNFIATVNASFQLIGISSSLVNTYSEYWTAAAPSSVEAIKKAEELATQKAIEALGMMSLKSVQYHERGMTKLRMTVVVQGISDRRTQGEQVLNAFRNAGCQIVRNIYNPRGELLIVITSPIDRDTLINEIKQITGLTDGDYDENALGADKIYLRY